MSFVDIAYLQKKNLKGDVLSYRRRKTNQSLKIGWEPDMQEILKRYEADTSSPYLFSIIKDLESNPRKQYQNMQFLINRHLKEIGKGLGLHQPLTMYCARHSWASIAHEEGIPLSIISEGMGDDSEKTTQIYLASLKTEVIYKTNRKILKLL
jgi:site-specific recombinase XerD